MMLTLMAMGQKSAVDRVFDKYSGKEGYTTVYISSFMFNLLSSLDTDDPEYNEYKNAISGINSDGQGNQVVRYNSECWEKSLPRTALQFVSIKYKEAQ